MLAIVGSPLFAPGASPGDPGGAAGLAAGIAYAAADAGAAVQIVGKVGDDPAGGAVLLALARGGVGHLAMLRDAGRATPIASPAAPSFEAADAEPVGALLAAGHTGGPDVDEIAEHDGPHRVGLALDPADIALGLQYVRDFRVLVAADPLDGPSEAVIADAAAFVGATLLVIAPHGEAAGGAPGTAIVLEAPEADPEGAFAGLVGRLAAAIDRGEEPAVAFQASTAEGGWERAID